MQQVKFVCVSSQEPCQPTPHSDTTLILKVAVDRRSASARDSACHKHLRVIALRLVHTASPS